MLLVRYEHEIQNELFSHLKLPRASVRFINNDRSKRQRKRVIFVNMGEKISTGVHYVITK